MKRKWKRRQGKNSDNQGHERDMWSNWANGKIIMEKLENKASRDKRSRSWINKHDFALKRIGGTF